MATVATGRDKAFRIVAFTNPRTGATSWRVTGSHRGRRVRENFPTRLQAEGRRLELDQERLGQQTPEALRATWLTPEQLRVAESIFTRHPSAADVQRAVSWWERHGSAQEAATRHAKDISLDVAVGRFRKWLDETPTLREATRKNLRYRCAVFASELGNVALASITPEMIEAWLDGRKVSPTSRSNDRRAIARFFAWCIERKQRYLTHNPADGVKVELPEAAPPETYSLPEVMRLLVAARRFRNGRFLKFITLQLFGGMRPAEALRFKDEQLVDGCIHVGARQSKTGTARTITADPVLLAWLKHAEEGPVSDPQKSKLLWSKLKAKARLNRWIADGLRHTAVSHFFRRCGSYGLTAEWAGNSEAVIKQHYQGRVSSAESARFWNLYPDRGSRIAARKGVSK